MASPPHVKKSTFWIVDFLISWADPSPPLLDFFPFFWHFLFGTLPLLSFSLQERADGSVDYPLVINIIDVTDILTVVFFSFEYFARLFCAPEKIKFFIQPMNIIDFFCLIPFYISLMLEGLEDFEIVGKAGKIVRFLKILRIFRVYKLFKHFAGLQSLLYTLQQAYKELGLLLHIIGKENKLGLSCAKLSLASAKHHTSLSSEQLKLATNYLCSTILSKLAEDL